MNNHEIFSNGCCWIKADFHLHTKEDKEFHLPEGYNPNEFVKDYITQLEHQKIQIGVITNHNKFDLNEFKALKKAALKKNIFLLPGVELSVKDGSNGIHALIVFDYDKWVDETNNYIEQFLTSAFEGIHNRENENSRCNYNITELLKKLGDHKKSGRDSFIIMAHIEQNSGFLKELNGGRISELAQDRLFNDFILGFQKLCTFDNINKIRSWYGERKIPAFVEGSDPKSIADIGIMGKTTLNGTEKDRGCYIKIGDYNFDSIKYALKDNSRISGIPVGLSNNFIKAVSFIGGKYDGQKINFSREMNNIIGIRGSGKSAILEVLRYVLRIDYGIKPQDADYKNGLIEHTLGSGGKAIIEIESNGHSYRYEKIYGQEAILYQDDNQIDTISIDTLVNKPIYFGQKDLSNSGLDFEADLVRRLTGTKLDAIKLRIDTKREDVSNTLADIKKLGNLKEKKKELQEKINDIEHKLKLFEEQGINEKLKKEADYTEDIVKLENSLNRIKIYLEESETSVNNYAEFFKNFNMGSLENKAIFDKAKTIFDKIKSNFNKTEQIHNTSKELSEEFNEVLKELKGEKKKLEEEFAKIKREIELPQINPDDFSKYKKSLSNLKIQINEVENKEKKRKDLVKKFRSQINELKSLWHDEYSLSKTEIERFNKNSDSLKIDIEFLGRKDKFKEFLKKLFRGTGLSDADYENIVSRFPDFIEIYKKESELNDILSNSSFEKFKKVFFDKIKDLITFRVDDKYTIKYHDKPLKDHSLGQRASALILFLLAQEDREIIIIDQPEDDLDNQTIYEDVIKILRSLKGKMQFIFATHNANIPVLGDSEQVISCDYGTDKFNAFASSIDSKEIQNQIISVMEGGREAFIKRKEIYSNWKN